MTVNLTHKKLQDWVKDIRENNTKMVTVLYDDEGDKPVLMENYLLNGQDYLKSEDKFGYILNNSVGEGLDELNLERKDILLPITSEVIEKVAEMEDSQAIARIEKAIYDIVLEENENRTR